MIKMNLIRGLFLSKKIAIVISLEAYILIFVKTKDTKN